MTNENQPEHFEPAENLVITRPETLKVLSDPLRSRILNLLRGEALTVKQLAAALDISPKKLYYHTNMMEQHGLIQVVSTRIVSGIIEKQYRACAYLFLFDNALFVEATATEGGALGAGIEMMFDTTKLQLEQSIQAGIAIQSKDAPLVRRPLLSWSMNRMPPAQAEEFYTRLADLLDEFNVQKLDTTYPDAQAYRLFVSLFPVQRHPARSARTTDSSTQP
jgi:DNA-binding transcriptional ArsR family regulator